jgi:translation initiation factor 1 (eIF-1/SUI1)
VLKVRRGGEVSDLDSSTLNLVRLWLVLVLQSAAGVSLKKPAVEEQGDPRHKLYTFSIRWYWYRFGGIARPRGVPGV